MDDFFSVVSKGVIIVPVIIVVLSLIFRFNQKPSQTVLSNYASFPTSTPIPTKEISLDLIGPWVCHYKNNNQEYYLSIKNKKISLEIKTNGQSKKYDLSPYSGLLENFLNLDYSQLENLSKPYLPKGLELKTLIESCKKE